jgi:hypothetical protein
MTYNEIIAKVADIVSLDKTLVNKVYKSYWRAVKEHIEELPLKDDLSEEDFCKIQPNVNIPSLGKLYVTYDRYKRIKKQNLIIKEFKEKKHVTH